MPQSPLSLSQAADAIDVSIQKYFLKATKERTEYFRKFYNVTTGVTDFYMKDSGLSGLGAAARIIENAVIVAEVPVQTFDKTYEQVQYGKIMSFTWRMWKFGIQKRDVMRVVKALSDACYRIRERLLHRKLDAAYLTSYTESDDAGNYTVTTSGGDSSALATASHTREDGGTAWSNVISDGTTSNMNLDYPGLKALWRVAGLMVDPKGAEMPVNPNRLAMKLGTAAHNRAMEIKSPAAANKIPGELSNDGSAIGSFEIVASPFFLGTGDATSTTNLSSATNWHAFDTSMISDEYGLQYFESEGITLAEKNVVFKTNEVQHKAELAFSYGHNDARGYFGSQGDNT